LPSLVAVMVALPSATAVARPLVEIETRLASLVDQVTLRLGSGLPLASFGVADSCSDLPTESVVLAGCTSTDATATVPQAQTGAPDEQSTLAAPD
jgi:hypothetical protein